MDTGGRIGESANFFGGFKMKCVIAILLLFGLVASGVGLPQDTINAVKNSQIDFWKGGQVDDFVRTSRDT